MKVQRGIEVGKVVDIGKFPPLMLFKTYLFKNLLDAALFILNERNFA